jgi:hypothetical protein
VCGIRSGARWGIRIRFAVRQIIEAVDYATGHVGHQARRAEMVLMGKIRRASGIFSRPRNCCHAFGSSRVPKQDNSELPVGHRKPRMLGDKGTRPQGAASSRERWVSRGTSRLDQMAQCLEAGSSTQPMTGRERSDRSGTPFFSKCLLKFSVGSRWLKQAEPFPAPVLVVPIVLGGRLQRPETVGLVGVG